MSTLTYSLSSTSFPTLRIVGTAATVTLLICLGLLLCYIKFYERVAHRPKTRYLGLLTFVELAVDSLEAFKLRVLNYGQLSNRYRLNSRFIFSLLEI